MGITRKQCEEEKATAYERGKKEGREEALHDLRELLGINDLRRWITRVERVAEGPDW